MKVFLLDCYKFGAARSGLVGDVRRSAVDKPYILVKFLASNKQNDGFVRKLGGKTGSHERFFCPRLGDFYV